MPWVPIHESGAPYTFQALSIAELNGSVVSYANGDVDRPNSGWAIEFDPAFTGQVRITAQSYEAGANRSGSSYWPSSFEWDGPNTQPNEAPPSPASAYPDNSPVSSFQPSPLFIEGELTAITYGATRTSNDQYVDDLAFAFLIEVWEEGPEPPEPATEPRGEPRHLPQKKTIHCAAGETRLIQQQWAGECEERNTTIESSEWATKDGSPLSGQTLTGTLASVLIAPRGDTTLTNAVTLANGETLVAWWLVKVQR